MITLFKIMEIITHDISDKCGVFAIIDHVNIYKKYYYWIKLSST